MNFFSKKTLIYSVIIFIFCSVVAALIIIKNISIKEYKAPPGNDKPNTEKVTIKQGDILALAINNTRLSAQDSSDIIRELKKVTNINYCVPGDSFEISYNSKTEKWTNFLYYPSGISYYLITKSSDNVIKTEKKEFEIDIKTYKAQGTITHSLWAAMESQNIPSDIIISFTDIFAGHIDFFAGTEKGDVFKIVYEIEQISKKNKKMSSRIIAAQYKTISKTHNAFYFKAKNAKRGGYFNENGKSLEKAFLKAPLSFHKISSNFSYRRYHPILKIVRSHEGIDYAAPKGTAVASVADGTVIKAHYETGGYGNLVVIKHPNGYETQYAHLLKYGKGVKKGKKVTQGQTIGYVGMTGLTSGPHLDFRIKYKGKFFDYQKMKQPTAIELTSEDKKEFKEKIQNFFNTADNR
ncbi:MAG: M23 family metallopeptidase [Endomicrobium sp.]|jgi:murein DD-endopeptidase MepM/ murein hydrolase activator NlpD|nr:M23 family metallopeptidase [Endomicrobium sp.]